MDNTSSSASVTTDTDNPAIADLHRRVQEHWDALSRAERQVAALLVRAAPERILYSSAADLGDESSTSNATVVRTIQTLGYRGLSELKQTVATPFTASVAPEVRVQHRLESLGSDLAEIASGILTEARDLVSVTEASVVADDLTRAVDAVVRAGHVRAYGVGTSSLAAEHLVLRLRRLGIAARWLQHDGFLLADELLDLGKGDALLVFSPGRVTPAIEAMLDHARMLGAHVVLVTDELADELRDRVLVALHAPRTPTGLTGEAFAAMLVADMLVQGVAAVRPEAAVEASHELTSIRARLGYS